MPQCSFCGSSEDKTILLPLCESCGSLRYPIATSRSSRTMSSQEKLKYSAIAAVTLLTPGSLVVLALVGIRQLGSKK